MEESGTCRGSWGLSCTPETLGDPVGCRGPSDYRRPPDFREPQGLYVGGPADYRGPPDCRDVGGWSSQEGPLLPGTHAVTELLLPGFGAWQGQVPAHRQAPLALRGSLVSTVVASPEEGIRQECRDKRKDSVQGML